MLDKAKDLYKFQKQARKIKNDLKNTHIESEHEGVIVTVNGKQEIISIEISENSMGNKKKLEESLIKALNKAIQKSQQVGAELMKDVMGDINFPGM